MERGSICSISWEELVGRNSQAMNKKNKSDKQTIIRIKSQCGVSFLVTCCNIFPFLRGKKKIQESKWTGLSLSKGQKECSFVHFPLITHLSHVASFPAMVSGGLLVRWTCINFSVSVFRELFLELTAICPRAWNHKLN